MAQDIDPRDSGIVYIREADRDQLPERLRDAPGKIFSVHDETGKALAVASNREQAFALAARNNLVPLSVH
ncbi:MAG: DUF1150 family protein [Pseudomonadota bacterium]